jgi:hypothetical protein
MLRTIQAQRTKRVSLKLNAFNKHSMAATPAFNHVLGSEYAKGCLSRLDYVSCWLLSHMEHTPILVAQYDQPGGKTIVVARTPSKAV